MKKKIAAAALSSALLCTMSLPALAAEAAVPPAEAALSDSVYYQGQVEELVKKTDGTLSQIVMESESDGAYTMNVSAETVWIDSTDRVTFDPAELKEGEALSVFHSPVSTKSIPPQSAAFAVVRNVSQTGDSARYHEVEAVELKDGTLTITTDNGGMLVRADAETKVTTAKGDAATLSDIKTDSFVMAWYGIVALSYPGQAHASQIMILEPTNDPAEEEDTQLTRADLVSLLHKKVGSPVVNYAMSYLDVKDGQDWAEAIRWATSEKLVGGYGDGTFGPGHPVSREQAVTMLWRSVGSPEKTDLSGLDKASDAGSIAGYARQAMAWGLEKGVISVDASGKLLPKGTLTQKEAEAMLAVPVES